MPNTTFRLFVIHFVYEYCDHELYNFDEMLYVEDTEVTCYAYIYNIILVPGFFKISATFSKCSLLKIGSVCAL